MKKIKQVIFIFAALLLIGGCDKDFVEVNTDPFAINEIEPGLLFAGAQRTYLGGWEGEHSIVSNLSSINDGVLFVNFKRNVTTSRMMLGSYSALSKISSIFTSPGRNH